ncbi:MAG TPA: hypothetical protein VFR15_03615 [Chloroflexia bacterium]|nr:hypothetical protein [Chloroflexia bacterium]
MAQGNVAGGGAVGAVIGGLMGAVIGWIVGAQMTDVPVIGPLTGSGVLASVLGGIAAGAGIGALIGALVGSFSPQDEPPIDKVVDAAPAAVEYSPAAVEYADDTVTAAGTSLEHSPDYDGPERASDIPAGEVVVAAERMEDSTMDDNHTKEAGRDPSTFTGTEDAIDPGTGALGTAGTPVTTGYGVSGSTIGTGSQAEEAAQRDDDFRGATPDTKAYDIGGRGSGDREVLEGDERTLPAETRYSDAGLDEAPVQRDREARDIYEASPGYGESVTRGGMSDTAPEGSGTTGVDADAPQESEGTNLPGTADPRGLGDNTDEPR